MSAVQGEGTTCSSVKYVNFPTFDKYDPTEHDKWAEGVEPLLQAAVKQLGLGDPDNMPCAEFINENVLQDYLKNLSQSPKAYNPQAQVLHAFAVKACPYRAILKIVLEMGEEHGVEVASPGELQLGLEVGFPPERIVIDSPLKTESFMKYAWGLGCHINLDSEEEIDLMDRIMRECHKHDTGKTQNIGVRINPCIGEGDLLYSSTSAAWSKFGIAMVDQNGLKGEEARRVLAEYLAKYKWLNTLHCHVGSQGYNLEKLIEGIKETLHVALTVNAVAGREQIRCLDIGGGLPTNYVTADQFSAGQSYSDYFSGLYRCLPELREFRLVTEFGRSVATKCGHVVSRVEVVKCLRPKLGHQHSRKAETNGQGLDVAIVHVGGNLFVRETYNPQNCFKRITVHTMDGRSIKAYDGNGINLTPRTIAGPLCYATDIVSKDVPLPPIKAGDLACIHDTGAYCSSAYTIYNSRAPPPVYLYTQGNSNHNMISFKLIRNQTTSEMLQFWGTTT
eukprot:524257_1